MSYMHRVLGAAIAEALERDGLAKSHLKLCNNLKKSPDISTINNKVSFSSVTEKTLQLVFKPLPYFNPPIQAKLDWHFDFTVSVLNAIWGPARAQVYQQHLSERAGTC